MRFGQSSVTILHVEDHRDISALVERSFRSFGFGGEFISVSGVEKALALLKIRQRDGKPVHLILVDVMLEDGTGLELIRAVKEDAKWHLTPIIVLSSSAEPEIVNAAYALGAGCFLPKLPAQGNLLQVLKSLYGCWLEGAVWPDTPDVDRLRQAIARSVKLRARIGQFYIGAAHASKERSDVDFWLERSLSEANMSNLLAFIEEFVSEEDLPDKIIDRLTAMQKAVHSALERAEEQLQSKSIDQVELCSTAMDLNDCLDHEIVGKVLEYLFKLTPDAALSFKRHTFAQIKALSEYVLARTDDKKLVKQAKKLQSWADSLVI